MYYIACVGELVHNKPLIEAVGAPTDAEFLSFLGRRVRQLRNRRGMTRKMVAREAAVSERHLAQLEAGDGNISILLLRRIVQALDVSLETLFAPEAETSGDRTQIERLLARLPKHRLSEAIEHLSRELGDGHDARRKRIALVGLRGAGKTTLGERLAHERGAAFVELDREIEKDAGMPLDEIFSLYGQSGYRRIESRALDRVLAEHESAVIAAGGGVVSEEETYARLRANCYTVWIKARPEEYMARVVAQGDRRAIAAGDEAREDLRRILEAREPLYRKADLHFDNSGESIESNFGRLAAALRAELG